MAARLQRAVVLGWFALTISVGAAAESQDPTAAVAPAIADWRTAEAALSAARQEYEALATEIAEQKQRHLAGRTPGPALEPLLRTSLTASTRLEALAETSEARRQQAELAVDRAVRGIDRHLRTLQPSLRRGSAESRAATARQMKALLETRRGLEERRAPLLAAASRPSPAAPPVEIDPLDGPSELREKADFVEDTREKLEKKRTALASLIRRSRQEHEVQKAAAEFQVGAFAFDEESRDGRVVRANATPSGDQTTVDQGEVGGRGNDSPGTQAPPENAGAPSAPNAPGPPPAGMPIPSTPLTINERFSGPALSNGPGMTGLSNPTEKSNPDVARGSVQPPPRVSAAPPTESPNLRLDARALLNLQLEALSGTVTDLGELQRLLGELDRIDALLRGKANDLRRRAEKLEEHEAKTDEAR